MNRRQVSLSASILTALFYSAQFAYPLTEDELVLWLPHASGHTDAAIRSRIRLMVSRGILKRNPPFIFLPDRPGFVGHRVARQAAAGEKWARARRAAELLSAIPWIRMVGVTGALSMDNASRDDDIDFCIVTEPGSVWTVRFLATGLFAFLGMRRRPGDTSIRDRICLNMFLSSSSLAVPAAERDFYTAHEVLQFTPVFERDGMTYRQFLSENRWVARFLPRAWAARRSGKRGLRAVPAGKPGGRSSGTVGAPGFVEAVLMRLQRWYMKPRVTREVISDNVIRFHPKDARTWIREGFLKDASRAGIPLTTLFPDHKIAVTS